MKTTLKPSEFVSKIKFIIFGIVVALGMSYVSAAWSDPSSAAPGTNIALPIHTGASQIKDGGISVNTFTAWQNAHFVQDTFVNGSINAAPGGTTVNFGGTDTLGTGRTVAIQVNGGFTATNTVKATNVAGATTDKLCADTAGKIVRCTPSVSTDVCPNITGNQSSVPSGMILDGNGDCVTPPPTDVCPNIAGTQSTIPSGMIVDPNGDCVPAGSPSVSSYRVEVARYPTARNGSDITTLPTSGTIGCPSFTTQTIYYSVLPTFGSVLHVDAALTVPLVTYDYVRVNTSYFNLNRSTGVVGALIPSNSTSCW